MVPFKLSFLKVFIIINQIKSCGYVIQDKGSVATCCVIHGIKATTPPTRAPKRQDLGITKLYRGILGTHGLEARKDVSSGTYGQPWLRKRLRHMTVLVTNLM